MTDVSLDANKNVVRRHYEELFNSRDLGVAAEITGEDYVEHGVAAFAERVGDRPDPIEGLKETVRWLTGAFPDLRIEVDDLVAEGDKVLAYITMRGTHEGEFQGIPPTGRSFEARAMHLFRIRDGKAVEHWAVREDLPMMLQLGLRLVPGA
jgi:steroid delta-isomerase-like uncharacterized protein